MLKFALRYDVDVSQGDGTVEEPKGTSSSTLPATRAPMTPDWRCRSRLGRLGPVNVAGGPDRQGPPR